ncbi:uncharacterized protein LOC143358353 [Halictus rubicundus]|uniref:uncharacterized protein LOC143358353 n=1 Tax=Halictus rubicundus TaxID=77578 RepID=UPI004036B0D3
MRLEIGVAILVGVAFLRSGADGQYVLGETWANDLTRNLGLLNRNIQENVHQLNQRISDTVGAEVAQVRRLTDNLNEGIARGTIKTTGGVNIVSGNNLIVSDNGGTRIVQSGRTSNGTAYVREISETVMGDTLRHVDKIHYPATNVTRVYGFTLDLNDVGTNPVPIDPSTLQ